MRETKHTLTKKKTLPLRPVCKEMQMNVFLSG